MLDDFNGLSNLKKLSPRCLGFLDFGQLPYGHSACVLHVWSVHLDGLRNSVGSRLQVKQEISLHLKLNFLLRRNLVEEELLVQLKHNVLVDLFQVQLQVLLQIPVFRQKLLDLSVHTFKQHFDSSKVRVVFTEELLQHPCLAKFVDKVSSV